jgi:phage regulator Rha-like protein
VTEVGKRCESFVVAEQVERRRAMLRKGIANIQRHGKMSVICQLQVEYEKQFYGSEKFE